LPIFQAGNSVVIAGSGHMTDTESKLRQRTDGRLNRSRDPAILNAALAAQWFWWSQVIYPHGDCNPPRVQQPTDDTAATQPLRVGSTSY
jgi:hypothetical protein